MLLEWGQQYITFVTGSFFPPFDPNRPVQLQLQCSLSSQLQPSILFVSVRQLPVFFFLFLKPLTFLYSPLLSFFSPWIDPSSTVSTSWCVLGFDNPLEWTLLLPPPLNLDSSALFLLLWGMLVCFSFAGRIVVLWEQGECFSPATGVPGWGVYICFCLNNVRRVHLGFTLVFNHFQTSSSANTHKMTGALLEIVKGQKKPTWILQQPSIS